MPFPFFTASPFFSILSSHPFLFSLPFFPKPSFGSSFWPPSSASSSSAEPPFFPFLGTAPADPRVIVALNKSPLPYIFFFSILDASRNSYYPIPFPPFSTNFKSTAHGNQVLSPHPSSLPDPQEMNSACFPELSGPRRFGKFKIGLQEFNL